MAFGIKRKELMDWKNRVSRGEIAFLTHYWQDPRFPGCYTVTKVGCSNREKLAAWGQKYGLQAAWIDREEDFPHFDLFGEKQKYILQQEQQWDQLKQFNL
ncbi:hypothetical protein ABRT01_08285 [Lentibacillus sp. L22]|uniref:hypothetical protein n=1 Tax=Lentibacillus TaxID=175304 RepID=UPI0022B1CCF7|nr:hypothetical protein [Lentibacillus daqui]